MQKLTAKHIAQINVLLLKTTEEYINTFVNEEDISNMYATDVAHNVNALVQFNKDKDVLALHKAIIMQDTLVREFYISVLLYIEDNALISANKYCCK
jgi:UDP-N-acetyl-D-mannosaminuronic acid transferase (WecB/TagA/CpsF family)